MAAQHTQIETNKQEFRWSFRKKGKDVLKLWRQLTLVVTVAGGLVVIASPAQANPSGGNVVGGSATISHSGTTTTIKQTTNRAIINWNNFDIAAGETTKFEQPSTSALALNRVMNSGQVTTINGNLNANGHVLIINPNGVLIGSSGNIDVGGFVASTADITNTHFMNGNFSFSAAGNRNAVVENRGNITIRDAGLGLLVAPTVRNSGVIQGDLARLQMGAADTFAVDFYGDGLLSLAVRSSGSSRTIRAENTGTIVANAGKVVMTAAAVNKVVNSVINTGGVIEAKGLIAKGGEIILTGQGAAVKVAGKVDASGKTGGGSIKIGGDANGSGALAKAKTVEVASTAQINANADTSGNGGTIALWSSDETKVSGSYSAKGGSASGNGGVVNTSSAEDVVVSSAAVDTSAKSNTYGSWVVAAKSIDITSAFAAVINSSLSHVLVDAKNDVDVSQSINRSAFGADLKIVSRDGDINILNKSITLNNANLDLQADDLIKIRNSAFDTKGGDVAFKSDEDIDINNTDIITAGGSVLLDADDDFDANSLSINTTGGASNAQVRLVEDGDTEDFDDVFGGNSRLEKTGKAGDVTIKADDNLKGNGVCISAGGTHCASVGQAGTPPAPQPTVINVTIKANDVYKTYGSFDPALTYTVTYSQAHNASFTGSLVRQAGENVRAGGYAINQGTLNVVNAGGYTYVVTYQAGTFTINPAFLTVTAQDQGKTYGDTLTLGTTAFDAAGLLNGETIGSVLLSSAGAAATANAGTYDINASGATGGTFNADNYEITYKSGTLDVDKAALTIIAADQVKTYGQDLDVSAGGYTHSSLFNNDTITSVMLASAGGAQTASAKDYAITASDAAGSGLDNYEINYVDGKLTVKKANLMVTANNQTKVYGVTHDLGNTGFTPNGLMSWDSVNTASLTSSGSVRTANVNANGYDININNAVGSGLGNYNISYVKGKLTVTPAALTITARDQYKVYGDSKNVDNALFAYFVDGLKNNDRVTDVSLTSTGGVKTANASGYDIVAGGASGRGLGNYTINYVNGTLHVTPALLTITSDSFSKTYGQAHTFSAADYGVYGLKNSDTVTGVTMTSNGAAAQANIGLYGIIGSNAVGSGLSNYTILYTPGLMLVNPAALTITADNQSKTYGSNHNLGNTAFSQNGLMAWDSINGVNLTSQGAAGTANAGTYAIAADGASGSGLSNYKITYVDGALTVNQAELMVVANNQTKQFGNPFVFNGSEFTTVSPMFNGDTVSSVSLTSPGEAANASALNSPYKIYASNATGSGLSNYNIQYVDGLMTVTPAPAAPTIVIDPLGRPVMSVANKVIVRDMAFEGFETQTMNVDVALRYRGAGNTPAPANPVAALAALEPAAGGDVTAEDLANLEPAAGGDATPAASGNSDVDCANSFLDNQPCGIVQ